MKNVSLLDYLLAFRYSFYNFFKLFLFDYVKTYKNFSHVLSSTFIKKQFPVKVVLKSGKTYSLQDAHQVRFLSSNNSWKFCTIEDSVITILPKSLPPVKFSNWEHGGDLIGVFLIEEYKTLPVKNSIVIDIGGNVGDSAIYFALKGAKKVISFEPSIKNSEFAKKNIELNNLNDKIIFNLKAVTANTGFIKIDPDMSGNQGKITHHENGIEIPSITLDDIVKNHVSENAVLKIDCEGCEYDIINQTSDSTLKYFSHIQIEYHHGYKDLKTKLEKIGFVVKISRPIRFKKNMFVGHIYAYQK
ncbi:MAG: FkbM family methyltransferase [Nitrosarchaeum sp.]|nr:FkbM family methyltransferase [Nitrosarchaeum sp.]